jgi:type IV secretion system protein VirB4
MRTLSAYAECLQVLRLKRALTPFLTGGPYAFFDAAHDEIALDTFTTFEMRQLLAMPAALPHVLRYLFWRMSERFTGRPTLVVLDEARKLLADATFGPEILDMLKERAKLRVVTVLSTQEVVDFSTSAAAQAIFASCKTFVYLPNNSALNPPVAAFYKDCALTDAQIHLLAVSTPKQDYLYKSDAGIRRFQLCLSALDRAIVAASTPEEITALKTLTATTDHEAVPAAWLHAQRLEHEAAIFADHYSKKP